MVGRWPCWRARMTATRSACVVSSPSASDMMALICSPASWTNTPRSAPRRVRVEKVAMGLIASASQQARSATCRGFHALRSRPRLGSSSPPLAGSRRRGVPGLEFRQRDPVRTTGLAGAQRRAGRCRPLLLPASSVTPRPAALWWPLVCEARNSAVGTSWLTLPTRRADLQAAFKACRTAAASGSCFSCKPA